MNSFLAFRCVRLINYHAYRWSSKCDPSIFSGSTRLRLIMKLSFFDKYMRLRLSIYRYTVGVPYLFRVLDSDQES